MKTISIILLCGAALLANTVSYIGLVSGQLGHIINVEATAENAQISYDSKDGNLLISIKAENITEQAEWTRLRSLGDNYPMSAMATRVENGEIQILLQEFRADASDIQSRQNEGGILFLLPSAAGIARIAATNESRRIRLIVSGSVVNLRARPATNAQVVVRRRAGDEISATRKDQDWYAVELENGTTAWVHESVVNVAPPVAQTPALERRTREEVAAGAVILPAQDTTVLTPRPLVIDTTLTAAGQEEPTVEEEQATTPTPVQKTVYTYRSKGRDPFLPLDRSHFLREGLPNLNNMTLVGILYDASGGLALFEEKVGNETTAFSMKVGDAVVSGSLLRIEDGRAVFLLREANFSYTVVKELNVN
jgi:uncharacterized protein YgiM (DUF1202 family)